MDLGRALPNRKGSWEEAGIQAEVCGSGSSRMAKKVRDAHMAKKKGGIDGKDVQSAVCMSSDATGAPYRHRSGHLVCITV